MGTAVELRQRESARLAALNRYGILDTPAEEAFDRVARLAAGFFHAPVALVSFLDRTRVWYKAAHGLDVDELARRDDSPCVVAALSGEVLLVPDAARDPRFCRSPLVTGHPGIRFFAGTPLIAPEGCHLGALCVFDTEPRPAPGADKTAALTDLAAILTDELELRRANTAMRESEEKYRNLFNDSPIGIVRTTPGGEITMANPALLAMLGVGSLEDLAGFNLETEGYGEGYSRAAIRERLEKFGEIRGHEVACLRPDGSTFFVRQNVRAVRGKDGSVLYYEGTVENITERKLAEQALQASVNRFRAMVQNSSDLVCLLSPEGMILYESDSIERLLGYALDELVGKSAFDYIHPDDLERVQNALAASVSSGADVTLTYRFRHADGTWRWLESTGGSRLDDPGLGAVVVNSRDVTQQVEAQGRIAQQTAELQALNLELNKRLSRLTALHKIDIALTTNADQRCVLEVILEQVMDQLEVDAAAVLIYQSQSQMLEYAAARGFRTGAWRRFQQRLGEGQAGLAALEQRVVHHPDMNQVPGMFDDFFELKPEGLRTYWAVPLVTKGRIQGVLELFRRVPHATDEGWSDFLEALANQAAITIENAGLVTDLQRSNLRLRLAYDTTIEGWARALDLKDEETAGHSQRVTEMTVALARQMGMGEDELVHVRRGALLHDIGKMGVPDSILLKTGKLDAGEWEAMKKHTSYALDLLSPIPFLRPALDIPYCHHEKWDGSGYPRGLSGQQIPLAARVFAVVDVWDALASDRPYRKAWPKEKVLDYLKEQSGRHFDPQVVTAFFQLLES